jgi:hypothetical protein
MSEVPHLPTVEAWNVAGGKLFWWPNGSLLWRCSRSRVELLLLLMMMMQLKLLLLGLWVIALILLLLWSVKLTPRWGIHHARLRRSTARITTDRGPKCLPLPLLLIGLINGLHHPVLINDGTRQVIVGEVGG